MCKIVSKKWDKKQPRSEEGMTSKLKSGVSLRRHSTNNLMEWGSRLGIV